MLDQRSRYSEVVLTRMSVKDGRIVPPGGMSYRVLVLPNVRTMMPRLFRKIGQLVNAGATVIAPSRPEMGADSKIEPAKLVMTADDSFQCWLNVNGSDRATAQPGLRDGRLSPEMSV
jgi:hypothetical protein